MRPPFGWAFIDLLAQTVLSITLNGAQLGPASLPNLAPSHPYVDEYFAMLRRAYSEKTNDMASNLIEGRDNVRRALAAQSVDASATWGDLTD